MNILKLIILTIILIILTISLIFTRKYLKGGGDKITRFKNNLIVHHNSDNKTFKEWKETNKVENVRQELYAILRFCEFFEYGEFKEITPSEAVSLRAKYENTNFVYNYVHKISEYVNNIVYSLSMKNLIEMIFINNGKDEKLNLKNGDSVVDSIVKKWGTKVIKTTSLRNNPEDVKKEVFDITADFYYNTEMNQRPKPKIKDLWKMLKFEDNKCALFSEAYNFEYDNYVFSLNNLNAEGDGMLFLNNCLVNVNFDERGSKYTYYFDNMSAIDAARIKTENKSFEDYKTNVGEHFVKSFCEVLTYVYYILALARNKNKTYINLDINLHDILEKEKIINFNFIFTNNKEDLNDCYKVKLLNNQFNAVLKEEIKQQTERINNEFKQLNTILKIKEKEEIPKINESLTKSIDDSLEF